MLFSFLQCSVTQECHRTWAFISNPGQLGGTIHHQPNLGKAKVKWGLKTSVLWGQFSPLCLWMLCHNSLQKDPICTNLPLTTARRVREALHSYLAAWLWNGGRASHLILKNFESFSGSSWDTAHPRNSRILSRSPLLFISVVSTEELAVSVLSLMRRFWIVAVEISKHLLFNFLSLSTLLYMV